MSEVFERRGCDVHRAVIEFDEPRYAKRFETFPMPHPFREVLGMIPAELRRRPAKIGIPATVTEREYDLVVVGSPTWWLSTNVPIRSFLESDVAARVLDQRPFAAFVVCRRYSGSTTHQGGQVRSLVVDQLPRFRPESRALPRREDPADQPAGASARAGARLRRRIGRSPSPRGDRGPGKRSHLNDPAASVSGAALCGDAPADARASARGGVDLDAAPWAATRSARLVSPAPRLVAAGSKPDPSVTASMPMTGDAIRTGSSPGLAITSR